MFNVQAVATTSGEFPISYFHEMPCEENTSEIQMLIGDGNNNRFPFPCNHRAFAKNIFCHSHRIDEIQSALASLKSDRGLFHQLLEELVCSSKGVFVTIKVLRHIPRVKGMKPLVLFSVHFIFHIFLIFSNYTVNALLGAQKQKQIEIGLSEW